ncbi:MULTISPECIES: hypothetical protein [unclassified Arthrobacter]|uniref:hypothetical protein n=1 Tax=unclassified Arthrobacter TaxID=235627 RepID=UPI001492EDBA|nr:MULTISPECIES: hypothetical protein [unclassified Arthrobacter]MBE0008949.1 hypothetical protein [Arthrobacter sp. AET 35A]NOJ62922.1 hypothetical protein [Arthrobacter sp. 147(2020)]
MRKILATNVQVAIEGGAEATFPVPVVHIAAVAARVASLSGLAGAMTSIISIADHPLDAAWPRQLARRTERGELIRIRLGCYVDASNWRGLDEEARYRVRVDAVRRTARREPVFGGETAGLLWGLPRPALPAKVEVVVPVATGWRSANGVNRLARYPDEFTVVTFGGRHVTGKVATAVELALRCDFPWAVSVMDRLLNQKPLPPESGSRPVTKEEVGSRIALLSSAPKRRQAMRVLEFADGRAMYPGESLSRVLMARLGFPAPELQHEVTDHTGRSAWVDFYWKEQRLVGEFDGKAKYLKPEYLRGLTTAQAVIEEKLREDRIRSTGLNMVRWDWSTAVSPPKLKALLLQAGLPCNPTGRRRRLSTA